MLNKMWLFVLTVLSCICFGFLLDVSSRKAESMDEDFVKRIDVTVEALASNYHNLLKTVIKDRSEIDSLIKQNQDLNQRLYKAEDKIEELKTNEEFSNQTIQTLQTITLELQRELHKEKYMSKKLTTNYNDLLLKVNCEVAFLKKQNLNLKRKLNTTEEKMEKLMSAEETSNQIIENLQNITSQQQHELNKAKSESKKSRLSVISSLTLLNNSLQELTISTSIGFKHLNGSVVKEKQLLIVREEMQKFERRINNRLGKIVDGQWSSWIDTPSSVTCGVGCRLRYRECSNPFPQQGGKKCAGSRNKYVKCLQYDPCPVHGAWSVWSENTCSVTCGVGTSTRSRNCSNPHPQYGGNNCTGNSTDHVTCTQPNECPVEVAPKTTDAPQTSAHFCNLEAERGSCTYYKVKWSYSGNDGKCQRFWYGGCEGNRNNFDSEEKCDAACRKSVTVQDVCKLPQSSGPCTREHRRWHFDQTIKDCREFLYGGCRGNKNRFITRAECLIRCGSDGVCQPYEEPLISCLGYFKRYRYSAETGDCEEFIYGGCNGNSNNFETMEACRKKCV